MTIRFDPTTVVPPEHVERVGEQLRDETELEGLQDDIRRNLKGEAVVMPWRIGRPLRSAGIDENPYQPEGMPGMPTSGPRTPLAALDLNATVPQAMKDRLGREFDRAAIIDGTNEGILDHAATQGVPLVEQETWYEADERQQKEYADGSDNEQG